METGPYHRAACQEESQICDIPLKLCLRFFFFFSLFQVAVTHGLQFLNKTSLNFAAAYDLRENLGLSGHRFAWVSLLQLFLVVF